MIKTIYWVGVAMAMLMAACSHSGGAADAHSSHDGHVHDAVLSLTAYSAHFEFFAECTPLVSGQTAEMVVHFTDLSDFKPVADATPSLQLVIGSHSVQAQMEGGEDDGHKHQVGIYHFELKVPRTTGAAMLHVVLGTDTINVPVTVYATEHQAHEAAEKSMPHSVNAVELAKEQSWKLDFATAIVGRESLGNCIPATGRVVPWPGGSYSVVAPVSGIVRFMVKDLTQGCPVKKGELLMDIDASAMPGQNLDARLQQVRNAAEATRSEYERIKSLVQQQLATASELAQAQLAYDAARAELQGLMRTAGSGRVPAPINGYLIALQVANGQYVEAGAELGTVCSGKDVMIRVEVPRRYVSELSDVDDAVVSLRGSDVSYSLEQLHGSVASVGQIGDGGSPLIPVVLKVESVDGLEPGMLVDVTLKGRGSESVLSVPRTALTEEMGTTCVWVQLTPELFEKRQVTTGRSDGRSVQVLSGLKPGERIVTRGAVMVKLAQGSGKLDPHAGHVH